jgi:hypothetical protein
MPKGKEIPKRVGLAIKDGSVKHMMSGNQLEVFYTYYVHCTVCGRAVYTIDSTIDRIADSVRSLVPQLLDNAKYCPQCGQKLEYTVLDILEGEYVEVNKTYPDNPPQPEPKAEVKEESTEATQENKENT